MDNNQGQLVDPSYCENSTLPQGEGKSSRIRRTQMRMEAGREIARTIRKGDQLRNAPVVLRSLGAQHRSHNTGSLPDFHPLWALRRRLRKCRTAATFFAASHGRNSIDTRCIGATKSGYTKEHACSRKTRVVEGIGRYVGVL